MPNINKNIIMQAGAAVANATNKAAGLSASTPEPGSIISAAQLVNGGRTIGPDALTHFTESVRNKLLSLLVSMEPIQDFNGYDHPWPAGGGINKCSYDTAYTATAGENTKINLFSLTLAAGTYTFSCKQSASVPTSIRNTLIVKVGSGSDQYENAGENYNPTNLRHKITFTVSEESTVIFTIWCHTPSTSATYNEWQVESGSFTAYAPYSNICPISGRTGLSVYVGPTSAIGDAATYSMDWTSPAGTVYAGRADIVSGDIKAAPHYASYNGETLVGPWFSSMDVYDPEGTPTTGAQVVDLGGTMTEYHITGQDIITMVGDNYIWSDSGYVTITE